MLFWSWNISQRLSKLRQRNMNKEYSYTYCYTHTHTHLLTFTHSHSLSHLIIPSHSLILSSHKGPHHQVTKALKDSLEVILTANSFYVRHPSSIFSSISSVSGSSRRLLFLLVITCAGALRIIWDHYILLPLFSFRRLLRRHSLPGLRKSKSNTLHACVKGSHYDANEQRINYILNGVTRVYKRAFLKGECQSFSRCQDYPGGHHECQEGYQDASAVVTDATRGS